MKSIKLLFKTMFVAVAFFSCAGHARTGVVVKVQPPARKVVVVKPAKPYKHAVWVPGHWTWKRGNYVWKKGHWVKPRKNHVYVPGHWTKRHGGWVWVAGHWKRV